MISAKHLFWIIPLTIAITCIVFVVCLILCVAAKGN